MGVCASPVIRKATKSIERSPQYGKYSKYKNTHEVIKNFCEKEWDKGYPINPNWRKIIFLSINQKYHHEVQYALFLKE